MRLRFGDKVWHEGLGWGRVLREVGGAAVVMVAFRSGKQRVPISRSRLTPQEEPFGHWVVQLGVAGTVKAHRRGPLP